MEDMIAVENMTIKELQSKVTLWADSVFPNRTAHDVLCKLILEEIPEFLLGAQSPEEYADLTILLFDIASLRNIDIQTAIIEKLAVNEKRTWTIGPTGMMSHVKRER